MMCAYARDCSECNRPYCPAEDAEEPSYPEDENEWDDF